MMQKAMKLDLLPKAVIGYTASFLHNNDYFNLCKVNRYLYLSCNSPNTLRWLRLNLQRIQLSLPIHSPKMQNIETLTLETNEEHKSFDMDLFLVQTAFDFENVKELFLFDLTFENGQFARFMSKFTKVQYLCIQAVDFDVDYLHELKEIPSLRGLELAKSTEDFDEDLHQGIIERFDEQLESLTVDDMAVNFSGLNFPNLQRLNAVYIFPQEINHIIETAVNLKKFRLQQMYLLENDGDEEIHDMMVNVIKSCKKLEYVCLKYVDDNLETLLIGIKNGLSATEQLQRERIKVEIDTIKSINKERLDLIVFEIVKIMNTMILNVRNVMFVWNVSMEHFEWIYKELKQKLPKFEIVENDRNLVIKNKDCNISYQESWQMYENCLM